MDTSTVDKPIVPQEEQIIDPGYSHQDLKDQSIREIAENTELPKPVEEKPEVKEEPKVEQLNIDEVAKKTAEETAKKVLEEQEIKAKEAEKDKVTPQNPDDEYVKWTEKFTKENGRTPNYAEAFQFMEERVAAKIEQRQIEQKQQQEEEQKKQEQAKLDENKRLNAYVDDELSDLYRAGKLTKILDPNNPSDQGVVERKALFAAWAEVNNERRAKNLPEIISPTRIYEFYYKKPTVQPAGANAPIAGNKGSAVPPSSEQSYSYQDLKKPWSLLGRR